MYSGCLHVVVIASHGRGNIYTGMVYLNSMCAGISPRFSFFLDSSTNTLFCQPCQFDDERSCPLWGERASTWTSRSFCTRGIITRCLFRSSPL